MHELATIPVPSWIAWLISLVYMKVVARRGIEVEPNPLREIEEQWDRDPDEW